MELLSEALGVLALRFRRRDQEYKVPGNLRIGGVELPVGLATITLTLLLVAIANLLSKKVATVYGITFTVVLFALFLISERINAGKRHTGSSDLEKFNSADDVQARPGCVVVAVRDPRRMWHLERALQKTNPRRHDVVVMTVHPLSTGAAEYGLRKEQIFGRYEQELLAASSPSPRNRANTSSLWSSPRIHPSMRWRRRPRGSRRPG